MAPRPILILAGGTGGHIFPALAVAARIRERGVPLLWLGTPQGLEATLVPRSGYRLLTVAIAGIRGKALGARLLAPLRMLLAVAQSVVTLSRNRPAAVLGMGGFVSGPGGLAAWLLRIPLLIHEQNAIPGLTNKLLARVATRVMEAFPGTFSRRFRAVHTGNPVRREIMEIARPAGRFHGADRVLRLLVMGGSQGASVLNQVLPAAVSRLDPGRLEVWHQTGTRDCEATRLRYANLGVDAKVEPFIEDMAAAYAWANLVLCRAGATTVFELAAAGLASILVPYPHAVDDHQTANARYLADRGAAILLPQGGCDETRVAALLRDLACSTAKIQAMAERARSCACLDATARVAELCLEVAHA